MKIADIFIIAFFHIDKYLHVQYTIDKLPEEINVTQPTLSHHMKILCDLGVVVGRKYGKWTHYSISLKGVEYAAKCLESFTADDE